ncbi:unnamed protein product [Toxocara canis]|uniref:DUF4774 domain-containing protein n=1 Tax=Toxocara canis TaxID=6265 RepID=A0A183V4K9_TOXCA|nr:unnamed protein product [Toxocara canis]
MTAGGHCSVVVEMSSYFSIGRQPGLFGNSVYFPARHPVGGIMLSETDPGKLSEIQGQKPTSKITGAGGDMPNVFQRIGGFEYLNPRGAAPLGGYKNHFQSNAHTPFVMDSPASIYGNYTSFQPETVFPHDSNAASKKTINDQPPTITWKESRWGMPTKMFNDSTYALGTLNNNAEEMETGRIKYQEEMDRLKKEADLLRAQEEDESLLTAMDKMSVKNEPSSIAPSQLSDSVYFSVPNMYNAFTGNTAQHIDQPVLAKYVVDKAPKVEIAGTVDGGSPPLAATLIPPESISDTDTAIEAQAPKVFADSVYAFDTEMDASANKTADVQSDGEEQLVTVSPITDSISMPTATEKHEAATVYVSSDYNFEELRGLEAFNAR